MSKMREVLYLAIICAAVYFFIFPDTLTSTRDRWLYDLLGPTYYGVWVRFSMACVVALLTFVISSSARMSKRIKRFSDRNAMLEPEKFVEPPPGSDDNGNSS